MENLLYHGIEFKYLLEMVRRNALYGHSTHRFHKNGTIPWPNRVTGEDSPAYLESVWHFGVCLTRSRQFAERWGSVVLILDKNKLQQRHKIVPYNWMETRVKAEFEEFVVTGCTGLTQRQVSSRGYCKNWRQRVNRLADENAYMGKIEDIHRYLKGIIVVASEERSTDTPGALRYSAEVTAPRIKMRGI